MTNTAAPHCSFQGLSIDDNGIEDDWRLVVEHNASGVLRRRLRDGQRVIQVCLSFEGAAAQSRWLITPASPALLIGDQDQSGVGAWLNAQRMEKAATGTGSQSGGVAASSE